jgi:hypothetical protein
MSRLFLSRNIEDMETPGQVALLRPWWWTGLRTASRARGHGSCWPTRPPPFARRRSVCLGYALCSCGRSLVRCALVARARRLSDTPADRVRGHQEAMGATSADIFCVLLGGPSCSLGCAGPPAAPDMTTVSPETAMLNCQTRNGHAQLPNTLAPN